MPILILHIEAISIRLNHPCPSSTIEGYLLSALVSYMFIHSVCGCLCVAHPYRLPRCLFELKLGSEVGHLAKTIANARRARAVRISQAKQTAKDGSDAKHLVVAKGANCIATVEAVASADNYGAAIDI